MQTQMQCRANLASLLSFCWVFLMPPGGPRRPERMGSGVVQPILCNLPLSPGAPPRVWNVEVKTKVPDRYQTSRGGTISQTPILRQPDNPKVGSVPSRQPVAGVVLHTILSAHLRCASARYCTFHVPWDPNEASWCDPQPAPIHHPYPACHPTLLLLLLLFFSSSACYFHYVPPLPCPPLLHLFLDRLTASPCLALHHLRQPPARATSAQSPPGRHHWNAQ